MRSNSIGFEEKIFTSSNLWIKLATVALASLFLAMMAQFSVRIPFTPVPISLQTLGVMLVALTLKKREATSAIGAYLLQATLGLPVLAGGISNPLWMVSPTAGYLVGFLIGGYIISALLERKERGFLWTFFALAAGNLAIYLLGCAHLAFFVGAENAIALGFVPFAIGGIIKMMIALSLDKVKNYSLNSRDREFKQ